MVLKPGVKVPHEPYWRESEVNSSCTRPIGGALPREVEPVRACGMEAGSRARHRTKVNPRKGRTIWVSVPESVMPDIQSWSYGSGGGGGAKFQDLTPGDLPGSARGGRSARKGGPMLGEKSDHLVVALKPGNAGGAKGVTV
jgi:hypothetical protein